MMKLQYSQQYDCDFIFVDEEIGGWFVRGTLLVKASFCPKCCGFLLRDSFMQGEMELSHLSDSSLLDIMIVLSQSMLTFVFF